MITFYQERRQAAQVLTILTALVDAVKKMPVLINKALRAKDVADSLQKGKRDIILQIMLEK